MGRKIVAKKKRGNKKADGEILVEGSQFGLGPLGSVGVLMTPAMADLCQRKRYALVQRVIVQHFAPMLVGATVPDGLSLEEMGTALGVVIGKHLAEMLDHYSDCWWLLPDDAREAAESALIRASLSEGRVVLLGLGVTGLQDAPALSTSPLQHSAAGGAL